MTHLLKQRLVLLRQTCWLPQSGKSEVTVLLSARRVLQTLTPTRWGQGSGRLLDLPVVSFVKEMKIEGNRLTAVRKLEDSLEEVEVELPAVVTVLPEINPAPIPGLKAVLDGGKKPVTEFKVQDLELEDGDTERKTEVVSFKGCSMSRKKVLINEGDAKEKVNALVAALKKEGVL